VVQYFKWPHPIFTFLWLSPLWRRHDSFRDVIEFLGNRRKTDQIGRKTPHPTWKSIIFCHFRSNPEVFIFSKMSQLEDFLRKEEKSHPCSLYLNKFEFLLPKDDLYQVWLKLVCWLWRRKFLKIVSEFLLFCYYLPFENCASLHLNKHILFPRDD
jgi:hypothetical protein